MGIDFKLFIHVFIDYGGSFYISKINIIKNLIGT